MNLLGISYGIGIISNSLTFLYIDNWQIIMLIMHVLPAAIAFLGVNFIVQDTPIELL
jgi:hypothetical protein